MIWLDLWSKQILKSSSLDSKAILILGYARPELIARRIAELQGLLQDENRLIISVDRFEGKDSKKIEKQFLELKEKYSKIEWIFSKNRLGLAAHITTRISELVCNFTTLSVIEDDVAVSAPAVSSMFSAQEENAFQTFMTIGLFGSLVQSAPFRIFRNQWRTTPYFSAWGWSVRKEMWSLYQLDIVKRLGREALLKTPGWNSLNDFQKRRWDHRFSKVEQNPLLTWDFQMQFISWLHGLNHALPLFRLCDNEGFEDQRSTNTKSKLPRWYLGKSEAKAPVASELIENGIITQCSELIDSYTWIGDRHPRDLIRRK